MKLELDLFNLLPLKHQKRVLIITYENLLETPEKEIPRMG